MQKVTTYILAVLMSAYAAAASADQIYQWVDQSGVTHFTNRPQPGLKPAPLARISRGDFKLARPNLSSCDSHGGVNCDAGADQDGSAICHDGFKQAITRFSYACNAPSLTLADISELKPDGQFSDFVRNKKPVKAQKPLVTFRPDLKSDVEHVLFGPAEIESFGMGEFVFRPAPGDKLSRKPTLAQMTVTCENCPSAAAR